MQPSRRPSVTHCCSGCGFLSSGWGDTVIVTVHVALHLCGLSCRLILNRSTIDGVKGRNLFFLIILENFKVRRIMSRTLVGPPPSVRNTHQGRSYFVERPLHLSPTQVPVPHVISAASSSHVPSRGGDLPKKIIITLSSYLQRQ